MSILSLPAVLSGLGQAGEAGLPVNPDQAFQQELQLCRDWGFKLDTTPDRVKLRFDADQLVPFWIQKETPAIAWDNLHIRGFLSLNSTNSEAMDLALRGAPAGTLVLSEEQTAGRGRKNRTWFSRRGAGLCCTLILRPRQAPQHWPLLPLITSVALVDAVRDLYESSIIPAPLDVDIKWPNDVLISGRKCAGILLETVMNDRANPAAVVGFGINVRKTNVPESLASEAISVEEAAKVPVPRRRLLVRFLYYFQLCFLAFEQGKHSELLDRWKSYSSMWNGIPVWIGDGETRRPAVTCGINALGALCVRRPDGVMETIFAETVRISAETKRKGS